MSFSYLHMEIFKFRVIYDAKITVYSEYLTAKLKLNLLQLKKNNIFEISKTFLRRTEARDCC